MTKVGALLLLGLVGGCSSGGGATPGTSDASRGADAFAADAAGSPPAPDASSSHHPPEAGAAGADAGTDAQNIDASVVDAATDALDARAPDARAPDARAPDAPDSCARTGLTSFQASNLPPGFSLPTLSGAAPVTGPQGFDTDSNSFPRVAGDYGTATAGSGADSPRVLYVTDFTLAAGSEFVVTGSRPLILVASGTVEIAGTIRTSQTNTTSGAGGSPSPVGPGNCGSGAGCPTKGIGPGGGGPGTVSGIGGGGAGYCGFGGVGSSGGEKGATYGNPEIVPLVAGSSGGSASYGNGPSGPGGGALQIVAGVAIVIEPTGVITMAGGGGWAGATGAGSGGSILLEAPTVTVNGVLAANGGGGGGSTGSVNIGEWGGAGSTPASGGGAVGEKAGDGSGGVTIDGADGEPSLYGTGGGGGAGRIRINTACGAVSVGAAAVISPAQTSACMSKGTLTKP